ncbi:MAG: aldehyde dehydrogenase family protein [Thermoanaerobaculia bacterium]|nr:aldehyde dehydrogenase family protein [Thermoanaerobaculia bacterium]MBP9825028.1 aldehyde dehydrogenase family protein [Thermoanaerobaculia bacterium]
MSESRRITYTSTATDPEFRASFDRELARVRGRFPLALGGNVGEGPVEGLPAHPVVSPIDTRLVVARVAIATPGEVEAAVGFARSAFPRWRALAWQRRAEVVRDAAERIAARNLELAAWMVYEVGKTRLEAMAEVEESADLLRYYAERMESRHGYRRPLARMSPAETTESVLLPYGVWAVVSPWNFPSALAAGMIAGALLGGNTVVFKPALDAPVSGELLCQAFWDAGLPRDALQLVHGPGATVGAALLADERIAGVAFTGSSAVGMRIVRAATEGDAGPRPVVVEMGGKNACLVTATADLDAAAEGVARSAFGFGGQKCSACSRVYVERAVAQPFLDRLIRRTEAMKVGDPAAGDPALGPVIRQSALESYRRYVEEIVASGGEIVSGGQVLSSGDLACGFYAQPTIGRLPSPDHLLFSEEMFLPILLFQEVEDLAEGIARANAVPYGLTAGLFTTDEHEKQYFLERIEAGVLYVNRRSGATTGAWPGINPFGGWKASGAPGPAALGPDYLLNFLREQSRTVNGFGDSPPA